jgi:hypothetical protein
MRAGFAPGFARQGEILHLRGDSAEALRLLTAGAEHRPGDVSARLVLARVCHDSGRPEESRAWLESVLRLDPECPAALFQLGGLLGGSAGAAHREKLAAQEPWGEIFRAPEPSYDAAPNLVSASAAPAGPIPEHRGTLDVARPAFSFPGGEEEEEPEIEENSAPHVATVTLAEIYFHQGLKEQAAQI